MWILFLALLAPLSYHPSDMAVWSGAADNLLSGRPLPDSYAYLPIYGELLSALIWPFRFVGIDTPLLTVYVTNWLVIFAYAYCAKLMAEIVPERSELAPLGIVLAPTTVFYIFFGANHVVMLFLLLAALVLIRKDQWLGAGFFAFFSCYKFLLVPTLLVLFIIISLRYGPREISLFVLGGLIFLIPNLVYYYYNPQVFLRIVENQAATGAHSRHIEPFHFFFIVANVVNGFEAWYIGKQIWFYLSMMGIPLSLLLYWRKRLNSLQALALSYAFVAIFAPEPFRLEPLIGLLWLDAVFREDLRVQTAIFLTLFIHAASWYDKANSRFLIFDPAAPLSLWEARGLYLGIALIITFLILLLKKNERELIFPERGLGGSKGRKHNWGLLGLAVVVLLLKVLVIDRFPNPFRRLKLVDGHLQNVDVVTQITYDSQFRLLGYDAFPERIHSGDDFSVHLYWQDTVPGGPFYRINLALKDTEGQLWSARRVRYSRWYIVPPPPNSWPPDGYAHTAFIPQVLPGAPPGTYTLTLEVFDQETLDIYPAHDAVGQSLGLEIPLGQIQVTRPRRPMPVEEVPSRYQTEAPAGPLRLVGYDLDRDKAIPGDPFLLTTFWQVDEAPKEDYGVRLRLLNPAGGEATQFVLSPTRDDFPTSQWQARDLWLGQHPLRLPANLESGEHRWMLQVCQMEEATCQAVGREIPLGTLQVYAPERLWEIPPLDIETHVPLGNATTLIGATLQPKVPHLKPGTSLTVTLAWQAQAEMDTSYKVFLHLLGPDGGLVTQSDGEPASWSRPTTGWMPGEVILDEHILAIPAETEPGEYQLLTGMYTPKNGRLTTLGGTDAISLTTIALRENQ